MLLVDSAKDLYDIEAWLEVALTPHVTNQIC